MEDRETRVDDIETPPRVWVKRLHPAARLPVRATPGAAGYDLCAVEPVVIPPTGPDATGRIHVGRASVRTGLALELPPGVVARIGSRSGLSSRANLEVGAGWIDPDYRGELLVELKNLSGWAFAVQVGDRIAQLVFLPLLLPELVDHEGALTLTRRGERGHGSTGLRNDRAQQET